ncbi:protein DpdF [Peribacillus simplex]|uniref:protein DpdF n=1 Tax=Peribacillus simplex TaxID=1478 RepID=UPI0011A4EACD|nr:protein DpdF [Peribacillus simplex]
MDKVIRIVKQVLRKQMTPKDGLVAFHHWKKENQDMLNRSKSTCVYRLLSSLQVVERDKMSGWYEVASHLRQVILMYNTRFIVHAEYVQNLEKIKSTFQLSIDPTNEVNALAKYPAWVKHADQLKRVFQLERRRVNERKIGDPLLYQMTGFSHYYSKEQKALVQTCLSMNEGETLLASLPTGGGKSLIGQLPAYLETKGGTIHGGVGTGGTTIVVVPTVALALDQHQTSLKYFPKALSETHRPQAYIGGMSEDRRKIIIEGLQNGTLPLLFTSPEALLHGFLHETLIEAAKLKRVNRLVIDEAHIVVDWGSNFRTDFQLLSVFRRKLLEASGGKLKTILLSATLTDAATVTLKELFVDNGKLIEIRSDALRFEPIYFLDQPKCQKVREERILEVIPLLPKPMILYVTKKEHAQNWASIIKATGFQTIETFTGETSSTERERILNLWNADQLDIIIATSAFGMGVDKPDVRTVIHCCLPESTNRFYQEVGRGGRDGFASISLLCTIDEDKRDAAKLMSSNVLTEQNMTERWDKMSTQPVERVGGDLMWVNTNVRPKHLKDDETGQQNANWNETTLLFLYRAKLIDILDYRKREEDLRRTILIQLLDIENLQDKEKLIEKIAPDRAKERNLINSELGYMKSLVQYAEDTCFSHWFQNTYSYTSEVCGGCPACHEEQRLPFHTETITKVVGQTNLRIQRPVGKKIGQSLSLFPELFITLPQQEGVINRDVFVSILNELTEAKVKIIVVPNEWIALVEKDWFESGYETYTNTLLLTEDELLKDGNSYTVHQPMAVLYPPASEIADLLYEYCREWIEQSSNRQVVHIAYKDTFIYSQRKKLIDLVDGNVVPFDFVFMKEELEEEFI